MTDTELREAIEKKVRYVAYHGTTLTTEGMVTKAIDDLADLFQAAQTKLLTELVRGAVPASWNEVSETNEGLTAERLVQGVAVPVSVIQSKIGELNG